MINKIVLGQSYSEPIILWLLRDGTYRLDFDKLDPDWVDGVHAIGYWEDDLQYLKKYIREEFGDKTLKKCMKLLAAAYHSGKVDPEHMKHHRRMVAI